MPWRLKGCQRCGGDLYCYDQHQDWTCLACGSDTTNGQAPSRHKHPPPTGAERMAGALERFLAKVAVEDTD